MQSTPTQPLERLAGDFASRRGAMLRGAVALLPALGLAAHAGAAEARRALRADDLYQIQAVAAPAISPDGQWVAYTLTRPDPARDASDADVWMAPFAGGEALRLTSGPESETQPRFSPDGRYLAFLAARDGKKSQVFLLDRRGGEPQRLTDEKGGVSAFAWSPDGTRLALVVSDPDPDEAEAEPAKDAAAKPKTPKPIVIRRLQFKRDGEGYVKELYSHLRVFDLGRKASAPVTSGAFDDAQPAWSPDGRTLAFVSNRTPHPDANQNTDVFLVPADASAPPRALTTSAGADSAPAFTPDGGSVVYVEGGAEPIDTIYTATRLAVVPVAGGPSRALTAALDRNVASPRVSPDGRSVLFLLEDGGNQHLARVPVAGGAVERVVAGEREVKGFALGPKGELAVLESSPHQPAEISAVTPQGLRRVTRANDAFLSGIRLAPVERLRARSADGTPVDAFLVRPLDPPSTGRAPLLLRPHGGPMMQDTTEFRFDLQLFAAHGFASVAPNYRGSTGYGTAFSRAIWRAWGGKDLEDVLAAVDAAVAAGAGDPERLGVGGWSYGGILTNYAITRTQRFKAAVSGASELLYLSNYGADDLQYWWETELGLPWRNVELWSRLAPFQGLDQVKTPTLVLCGAADMRVPLLNSEQLYQALRRLGVPTELVVYPGEYHEFATPSYQKDVLERSLAWYGRHLAR